MPRHLSRKTLAVAMLGLGIGSATAIVAPLQPAQALIVFDPSNYAQNILTAARTLQQINQEIQSLQNEATMLTNMGKNLSKIDFPQLQQLQQKLQQIDQLMGQAQGVDFRVDQLEYKLRQLYPSQFDRTSRVDQRVQSARARLDTSMDAFRQTMTVQAQVVENVHDDAENLSAIVGRSQGAEGGLQAQQATNQLLALTAKQQFQLQQMMAAQFRSESVEQARRVQQSQEAQAATTKFLGSGKAYIPQ